MTVTEPDTVAAPRRSNSSLSLTRSAAVIVAVLACNLAVYALGRAVGATFRYTHNGKVARVDAVAVTVMSVLPLATGLALTAWLSRRWSALITIAKVVAPVLAVVTIGAMTIPARFDVTSALCLSTMHLALIPAVLYAAAGFAPR
ncbi:MAG: DUF6069 family protein [Acidimicrobiales bacterium]